MMSKKYKLIILIASIFAYTALIFFGSMYIHKNRRVNIPINPYETFFDERIELFVHGDPFLAQEVLFASENIAYKYAKILYLENYGAWDNELELWVKHYKKYGVWVAWLHPDGPSLDGPPLIIFKDTDGQVIWYGN